MYEKHSWSRLLDQIAGKLSTVLIADSTQRTARGAEGLRRDSLAAASGKGLRAQGAFLKRWPDHGSRMALSYPVHATGLAAGFVDSIAGGGGLMTIPVLLSVFPHPAQDILGTNKFQATFGSGSATWHYWNAGLVELNDCWAGILWTGCGALAGTLLVQNLSAELSAANYSLAAHWHCALCLARSRR